MRQLQVEASSVANGEPSRATVTPTGRPQSAPHQRESRHEILAVPPGCPYRAEPPGSIPRQRVSIDCSRTCEPHCREIESRTQEQLCPGVTAALRGFGVECRTRPDGQIRRVVPCRFRMTLIAGHRHGDFGNGNASVTHCLGCKQGLTPRRRASRAQRPIHPPSTSMTCP
jgi:hypothetical protein